MGEKIQRVKIEMTAEQQAEGRREVSRYHYTGTLLIRNETVYISYEEEMEGDRYRTLLTCGDGKLTMSRGWSLCRERGVRRFTRRRRESFPWRC